MPETNHLVGSPTMTALIEQYNKELFSALVYFQLAAVVERDNYLGFSKLFQDRAAEELEHAHKFFTFISDADGTAYINAMEEPKIKDESLLGLFRQALKHEQFISDSIFKLKELAVSDKEHPTEQFLAWFIEEQVEEEASLDVIISNLERIDGNEAAILELQESEF